MNQLPSEVLLCIALHLSPHDLLQFRATNTTFARVSFLAWKELCLRKYKQTSKREWKQLLRYIHSERFVPLLTSLAREQKLPKLSVLSKSSSSSQNRGRKKGISAEQTWSATWQFLYRYKPTLENRFWLYAKDPVFVEKFASGTMEDQGFRYHQYHLFPTCIDFDDRVIVAGSGAYEMIGDPTTLMVGNRIVQVWDTTGNLIRSLPGHTAAVVGINLRCDKIVSCGQDSCINIWNLKTVHPAHSKRVLGFQCFDGLALTCSKDNTFCLWNLEAENAGDELVHTFEWHQTPVIAVKHASGLIASAGEKKIGLWDMELRSRIVALNAPQPITCLDFDGATVMACCKKNIYQFDSRAKQAQSIVSGNKMGFRQIYFDNCRIITACLDGKIRVFDRRTSVELKSLNVHAGRACFKFDPTTSILVTGGEDHLIKMYRITGYGDTDDHSSSKCKVM